MTRKMSKRVCRTRAALWQTYKQLNTTQQLSTETVKDRNVYTLAHAEQHQSSYKDRHTYSKMPHFADRVLLNGEQPARLSLYSGEPTGWTADKSCLGSWDGRKFSPFFKTFI